MAGKFLEPLELEYLDGRNWKVTAEFDYLTRQIGGRLRRVAIPAGFVTDFASVPRVLWNLLPPTASYGKAAVIHDALYRTRGLATRAQADRVLLEAMQTLGVSWLVRSAIYAGVRLGGRRAYRGGL